MLICSPTFQAVNNDSISSLAQIRAQIEITSDKGFQKSGLEKSIILEAIMRGK